MKPKIIKIIRFDYASSFLTIISLITTILLILIITVDPSVLSIIIPVVVISIGLLVVRVNYVRNEIFRLKDSKVRGDVHRFDHGSGMFYIVVNYEVKTRSLGKRIPVFAGPLLRAKLRKMKEINLLVDMNNPKKVYIRDFYYE